MIGSRGKAVGRDSGVTADRMVPQIGLMFNRVHYKSIRSISF
jgi:hypothetical protein